MSSHLNIITPYLHPDLVLPDDLSHIQLLTQTLPAFSPAGFECRLGKNQSKVDFQFSVPCLHVDFPESLLANPSWQVVQKFCQEWVEVKSVLHHNVDNIIVELDIDVNSSQVPIPCIFVALKNEKIFHAQEFTEIIYRLFNYQVSSSLSSNLKRCMDSLFKGGKITHLGAMLARQTETVRINVKQINPTQLLDYLKQIGLSNSTNFLFPFISEIAKLVDYIVLSVDIGEIVYSQIGLECFLRKQPAYEPRWEKFLNYLVLKRLCTETKRDGLLSWPGLVQKASVPDLWPKHLTWADAFLYQRALSLFWRRINHIKIVYQEGNLIEAKGYLAFGHRWIDRKIINEAQIAKDSTFFRD